MAGNIIDVFLPTCVKIGQGIIEIGDCQQYDLLIWLEQMSFVTFLKRN